MVELLLTTGTAVVVLLVLALTDRGEGEAAPAVLPSAALSVTTSARGSAEELTCRILFLHDSGAEELVLDCVVVDSTVAPPGTPFSLTVGCCGPDWFASAVVQTVERWSEEDEVVRLVLVRDEAGERVDARNERTRVRLAVRSRAHLG